MRLTSVLTPLSSENLTLAAQCGVTEITARYPGPDIAALFALKHRIESFGLSLSVIEGDLPIERIKLGIDDGTDLRLMEQLVRNMGQAGIPVLCYNFMAGSDWVRTRADAPERGGARVTEFRETDAIRAITAHRSRQVHELQESTNRPISAEQLWDHLTAFLERILPIAEDAGVVLAMHPDDPPIALLDGRPRIMNCVDAMERLVRLVPSPGNGLCFCQGTLAATGVDIPSAIRRLGSHIRYVHFRDVRGTPESFTETCHDNGPTDMAAAMRAYRDIGFTGPIRADHVPQLFGEDDGEPGYTMLGRLFAWGYLRGLMHATDTTSAPDAQLTSDPIGQD